MKKVLALFIVTLLVLTLAACGGNSAPAGQANEAGNTQTADNADTQATDNAQAESAEEDSAAEETDTLNPADVTDWKEYIKEYEARVDEFIEVYKQYKAAPLNAAIADKYEKYAKKVDEWTNGAQELIKKLTMEDIAEFAAEIERIAQKTEENIDE